MDYKRAFDSVSSSKWILKLRSCGISDQLLNWIESFSQNRLRQTRVGTSFSNVRSLTRGVVLESVTYDLFYLYYSSMKV